MPQQAPPPPRPPHRPTISTTAATPNQATWQPTKPNAKPQPAHQPKPETQSETQSETRSEQFNLGQTFSTLNLEPEHARLHRQAQKLSTALVTEIDPLRSSHLQTQYANLCERIASSALEASETLLTAGWRACLGKSGFKIARCLIAQVLQAQILKGQDCQHAFGTYAEIAQLSGLGKRTVERLLSQSAVGPGPLATQKRYLRSILATHAWYVTKDNAKASKAGTVLRVNLDLCSLDEPQPAPRVSGRALDAHWKDPSELPAAIIAKRLEAMANLDLRPSTDQARPEHLTNKFGEQNAIGKGQSNANPDYRHISDGMITFPVKTGSVLNCGLRLEGLHVELPKTKRPKALGPHNRQNALDKPSLLTAQAKAYAEQVIARLHDRPESLAFWLDLFRRDLQAGRDSARIWATVQDAETAWKEGRVKTRLAAYAVGMLIHLQIVPRAAQGPLMVTDEPPLVRAEVVFGLETTEIQIIVPNP